ncbi:hypothetical protein [Burkholderia stagnalis]|uniref:hypothetical protein n=1 Tax=Burkholderia stagnalis TaxID=1503054 RepID=UPI000F80E768|nr:hypothetical protein [Burkholderia stagnalis]
MSKVNETQPVGARIIALMSDRNEWTAKDLKRSLGLTTIQVRQAIRRLTNIGIVSIFSCVIASRENVYTLNTTKPDRNPAQ